MEYQSAPSSLPTQTNISFYKINHTVDGDLSKNIFKSCKNSYIFNPHDRPVGGTSTIKRIKDSFFIQSNSICLNKATLSTKTDTLLPQDSTKKTKTQFNATTLSDVEKPKQEILKRDIRGLSVDRIKMVNKRIVSKKDNQPTIYERTSKPFLEKMNKRSMSDYAEQLTNKYGNSYFQKTLRNSYKDDPSKLFVVTLFDKERTEVKSTIRRKIVNMPFFKRHQFMEVKGEDKREKQIRGSRTQLY